MYYCSNYSAAFCFQLSVVIMQYVCFVLRWATQLTLLPLTLTFIILTITWLLPPPLHVITSLDMDCIRSTVCDLHEEGFQPSVTFERKRLISNASAYSCVLKKSTIKVLANVLRRKIADKTGNNARLRLCPRNISYPSCAVCHISEQEISHMINVNINRWCNLLSWNHSLKFRKLW